MKRLCATVLVMEVIVIGLAIPVAIQVSHASPGAAGLAGGLTALAALLLAVLARRSLPLVLVAGSALQLSVILAGVIVPVMYFIGALFAGLWAIGIWLGHRVETLARQ
ncbi:MAG TPA: DUF4233 domain-containing protein [Streptosporangiaceae bacterium]|jgi:hypothetical protein